MSDAPCPHYMGFTRKMCPKCYASDRDDEAYERVLKRKGKSSGPADVDEFMDMVRNISKKRKPS